jgi:hypothetical protein
MKNVLSLNAVEEPWKVDLLAATYRAAPDEVPPVVVIRRRGRTLAINGSHRLAAMDLAFGGAMGLDDAADLGLVEVVSSRGFPSTARRALDGLRGAGINAAGLRAIAASLPAAVRSLLESDGTIDAEGA